MITTTRLLQDLVALPSINPMGRALDGPEIREHQVTAYLETFFASLGVRHERQPIAPKRDNIVAFWEPPDASSTLIWEVHQDTVPVDGMTIDPFGAVITDGKLYGRGACDVKGGMASMLSAFARLVREKPRGACRVILACTVDEEHTFLGVQHLVKTPLRKANEPIAAVVAEPTQLDIVHAHKGVVRWHLETTGRSCHSSRPEEGVNAIYRMGALLPLIETYARQLRESKADPLLGPPTLSVGLIRGGASVNTVPDRCVIDIDRRLIPGEGPDLAPGQLSRYLHERVGDALPFHCSEPLLRSPALSPAGSEELREKLGSAIDELAGSHRVVAVPYGTDASTLAVAGIPSVVFGPGDIAQAHTCDEWVCLDQVERAGEILFRLACKA
jgi:acetylornithine deacetylase